MPLNSANAANVFREAQRRHMAGDVVAAVGMYKQLLRSHRDDANLLYQLGSALLTVGNTAEAREYLLKALKHKPDDPLCSYDLALTFKREGRLVEARQRLQSSLKKHPGDALLTSALADIRATEGAWEEAYDMLLPLARAQSPNAAVVQSFARIAGKKRQYDEAISAIRRALADDRLAPPVRSGLLFALGEALDTLGEYDSAFEAYQQANALRVSDFVPAMHRVRVQQMIANWSPEAIARLPKSSVTTDRPVFIVGMPRSGTSLVEQILACHPEVVGAGELNDVAHAVHELTGAISTEVPLLVDPRQLTVKWVQSLARSYIEHIKRLAPRAARVTDKMPLNALHLGVIAQVFPNARVIHCRRDPMDTCLSCYFQHFGGNNPFAYDLGHLGSFYADYERLMNHWKATLKLSMLEVQYEELVSDLESGSRRMVEYIGLPWHDACLRFHESRRIVNTASRDQVRQPIYQSSVGRWRNYERHLHVLKTSLGGGE